MSKSNDPAGAAPADSLPDEKPGSRYYRATSSMFVEAAERKEIPHLIAVHKKYQDQGVEVVTGRR